MADPSQKEDFDAFEAWLKSCSPVEPPADLRELCRDTIPEPIQTPQATSYRPWQSFWRMQTTKAALGGSALAATVAIVFLFAFPRAPQTVLAQAIEESKQAVALHVGGRFRYPDRETDEVIEGQWGWVRDAADSKAMKNVGGGTKRILWRDGMVRVWDPESNPTGNEPEGWTLNLFLPWFSDTQESDLLKYERMASEQEIPIEVEEIWLDGRKIRRVRIAGLRLGESATDPQEAGLHLDMITDIDVSTNRIVGIHHQYTAFGKEGTNRFAKLNATLDCVVDYANP